MKLNVNFNNLSESYLFTEVAKRIRTYQASHPEAEIIRMDIGDVTRPLATSVVAAMHKAVDHLADADNFHGYGPEQGYAFLREAIALNDYQKRGLDISADEIFVSDGAKCDIGNFTDLMAPDDIVGIPDPVYPVYVDSNIIAGRNVENGGIRYIECSEANDFKPSIPKEHLDVVYLCSPNNPTGSVLTREELKAWVDYAHANQSLILFDSAYEIFVRDEDLPRSIYEIEGADRVAVEIRSFSKTAGFTGIRCGYTVVPRNLFGTFPDGTRKELARLWLRRQTTKFNGASYVSQRGAEAIYTPEGQKEIKENIDYYLRNARLLKDVLESRGVKVIGGGNSPYVWFKLPGGRTSWEVFDLLLDKCHISTTPGSGFGRNGEGCIRMTGFSTHEKTLETASRLRNLPL